MQKHERNMSRLPRRALACVLMLCMLVMLLPAAAMAADDCDVCTPDPADCTVCATCGETLQKTCVVCPAHPPQITTPAGNLPDLVIGSPFWTTPITATPAGGVFSVVDGSLPTGMTGLNPSGYYMGGVPNTLGTFMFTLVYTVNGVPSAPVTFTINVLPDPNGPVITDITHSSDTYLVGSTVTFTVVATSPNGGTLSYEWYSNSINSYTGGVKFDNFAENAIFQTALSERTWYVYCVVTNTHSGGVKSISYSDIVQLTINRRTPVVGDLTFNIPTDHIYNGSLQGIGNVTTAANLGAITVKYNGSETIPTNAGTYTVTADIAQSTLYSAATVTLGTYTIAQAPLTLDGGTVTLKSYDGTDTATVTAVTFGGLQNGETLEIGVDYEVTNARYQNGADAGPSDVMGFVALKGTAKANNYQLTGSVVTIPTQTISQATGIFGNPAAINTTYTPTLTLSDLPPPAGYTWNTPGTTLSAGNNQSFAATYTDTSGNYLPVTGNITVNVAKANQTAPSAPTVSGSPSATSITLNTIAGAEYRQGTSSAWQDSPTFSGLTPNTGYTFYARIKETATHNTSPVSNASATITTDKATLSGTVTISGNAVFGQTLTAGTTGLTSTPSVALGTLTYEWLREAGGGVWLGISGATSPSYTLVEADIGKMIVVRVSAANCNNNLDSNPTAAVAKAAQAAPALNFSISSGDFPKTITITEVAGAEYRFNIDGEWSNVRTFVSNNAEGVILFIRFLETQTHFASDVGSITVNTGIQSQDTPAPFALQVTPVGNTSYTVTIPATPGAEYRFAVDGAYEDWGIENVRTGLTPNTQVTGYKRMAVKPGYNTSGEVSASVTLPLFTVQPPVTSEPTPEPPPTQQPATPPATPPETPGPTPEPPPTQQPATPPAIPPATPPTTQSSPSAPTPTPIPAPTTTPEVSVYIPEDSVANALQSETPFIKLSEGDSTVISAESLQAIRESGKILEIELTNGLIIRIDPELITDNAITLNLHIDASVTDTAATVNTVHIPANSIVISPSSHGNFGFTMSFDISADKLAEAGIDISNAQLYHITTDGVITEKDYMKVNADGSVTISVSYASRYVITEETPVNDIQVDTASDNGDMIDSITPAEPITPSLPETPTLPVTAGTQNNDTGSTLIWVLIGCAAVTIVIGLGVYARRKRKRV